MKKTIISFLAVLMLTGCGANNKSSDSTDNANLDENNYKKTIITQKGFDETLLNGEYKEMIVGEYGPGVVTQQHTIYYDQDEIKGYKITEIVDFTPSVEDQIEMWNGMDEDGRNENFPDGKPSLENTKKDQISIGESTKEYLKKYNFNTEYKCSDNYYLISKSINFDSVQDKKDYDSLLKEILESIDVQFPEFFEKNNIYDKNTKKLSYFKFMDNIKQLLDPALYNYSE